MIPLIQTGGSAYAIGHDVGRAMRERLEVAAASARAELGGLDPDVAARAIGPYLAATERAAPAIVAELRGMADGSGVAFATLFVLNAGAELAQAAGLEACTVAGVPPEGT
ncbi:MAG TPA: hypothetical protein VFQ80_03655, partial [Thermomicrobiales bacterium]|nr:hypothetical protein [Thermomicrobiales bacterium]